jgi:universal stress protein A
MLRFSNILCPVDFDQNSLAAISVASELARENKAALYLLHVLHPAPEGDSSIGEIETAARTRLERIGHQRVKAGTSYELLVIKGDPAADVLQVASGLGADLIVMATHGRKGLRRLVLGSVAERVVREARCPVLTVKRAAVRTGVSQKPPRPKRIREK